MEQMTIGQRIASRRKLANLSQETVAEEIGVSRQSISKWESDAGLPDIDNLIALSKTFGVSVGWLLGTEQDPSFDPSTGLSDAQLRMVEKVVSGRRTKLWQKWLIAALAVCAVIPYALFPFLLVRSNTDAREQNAAAQEQISALEGQISTLKNELTGVNDRLAQKQSEEKLLLSVATSPRLSSDRKTVSIDFVFIPKLYQENAQAYLTVRNGSTYEWQQQECHPMGKYYFCRVELPAENGYSYSFILANDSGFQEQQLKDEYFVGYLENLYDATCFRLDESADVRTEWRPDASEYTFTQPIASPFFDSGLYVGYKAIDVTLYLNGTPIHTESLREGIRDHAGPYMWSEDPFIPDIRATLPALSSGDTLRLELRTECYGGEVMTSVLEELTVTAEASKES